MTVVLLLPLAAAEQEEPAKGMTAKAFKGLEFRGIGPALTSGRIGDVAVDPSDRRHWYVAVLLAQPDPRSGQRGGRFTYQAQAGRRRPGAAYDLAYAIDIICEMGIHTTIPTCPRPARKWP